MKNKEFKDVLSFVKNLQLLNKKKIIYTTTK